MANAATATTTLVASKAPNLPIGPVDYSQQHQDQFSNTLRLYFAQGDNNWSALLGSDGGRYIRFPNVSAYYSPSQYATSNTATNVLFNTATSISGFTLNANSTATCQYSGVYKIDYSLQFANDDNAPHDADVWLKVNNVNVVESGTRFTIPQRRSANVASYVCGYSHVTFPVNAGDVIGLEWATDLGAVANVSAGVYMVGLPSSTSPYSRPSIPSSIGTIQFVSAPVS